VTVRDGAARRRDIGTYLTACFVSDVGDSALWLALGVWVRELTGSSSAAGLVFLAFILGGFASPLTGILADRLPRLPAIIATNLVAAVGLAPLLLVHDRGTAWIVYPVMLFYGVAGSLVTTCQGALVPLVVGADSLGRVNGISATLNQVIRVIAPGAGAGLFVWLGGRSVVLIDAATFVVAAGLLTTLRVREAPRRRDPEPGAEPVASAAPADAGRVRRFLSETLVGMRHLWTTPVLRQLIASSVLAFLVVGFFETLIFAISTQLLHHSAAFAGAMATAQGVGGIGGAILASWAIKRLPPGVLVALGFGILGVTCVGLLVPDSTLALVAMACMGASVPFVTIGLITALQLNTPDAIRGRVIGAFQLCVSVPQSVSIALGALLLPFIGPRPLLVIASAVLLLAFLFLVTRPEQRATKQEEPAAASGIERAQPLLMTEEMT